MGKVKLGDIVEIKTSVGLAYAIYTHVHEKPPKFGAIIRVFDQLFQARPESFLELVAGPVRFVTFFPLRVAVSKELVSIVGNVGVPDSMKKFPIFRSGSILDPETKRVSAWWLWDGIREWRVGQLSPEQRKLPIRGVWNDTLLVQRIEENWRPENDHR
jgi:hypothetical protein